MVNRHDQDNPRTAPSPHNVSASDRFSLASASKFNRTDDVIASLANARENLRARQVSEWEKLRRQTLRNPL